MHAHSFRRTTIASLLLAIGASVLPIASTSCNTPAGQNAFMGGLGGAALGGLIGGRRGAVAGAITGGIIGAATTPEYRRDYYPSRPSSAISYRYDQ